MGTEPPLSEELAAFGAAVASGDAAVLEDARSKLHEAAGGGTYGDHTVYDAAAVVGFFASITKVVDLSGHYDSSLMGMLETIGNTLRKARRVRMFITAPFRR